MASTGTYYRFCWCTAEGVGAVECDTLAEAKRLALCTISGWISGFWDDRDIRWGNDYLPRVKEKDIADWNRMVEKSAVHVEKYNKKAGQYMETWRPAGRELERLGFVLWDKQKYLSE